MSEIGEAEKRMALEKVLASRPFEKSTRARDLLSYIVEQDIAGQANGIKGFTIAMDVFGKDETFDAVSDPLVRVQAGRLRDYLKDYYSGEGASDPVVISVPRGGYRPEFRLGEYVAEGKAGEPVGVSKGAMDTSAKALKDASAVIDPIKRLEDVAPQPSPVTRNQIRWVWAALGSLFVLMAGIFAVFFFTDPEKRDAVSPPKAEINVEADSGLPILRVFHEGNSPEVLFSSKQLSEIVSKFDFVTTSAMASADEITNGEQNWSELDYGFRLSELAQASIDGPKNIRFELLHLSSGSVLRVETYPADVWASPSAFLLTASKLNAVASPEGLILADMLARGTETPITACARAIRLYYERRIEERHRPAYECTGNLQDVPFSGGIMLAANGGLAAEAAGKGFEYDDLPADRDAALEIALQRTLTGVDLAPSSARAAREVGFVRSWRGEMSRMGDWFRRAYELNPCDTSIAASYGYGLVLEGEFGKAARVFEAAVDATTRHPTWWDFYNSVSLLMDGRLEDAKRAAEPLVSKDRNLFYAVLNASIAFETGNAHLAAKQVREIRERFPKFVENPEGRFAKRHLPQALIDRLVEDLRASGL